MGAYNEKELVVGKPSVKTIPLFVVFVGIVLLLITITTRWSWDDLADVMFVVSPVIILIGIVLYVYMGLCSITVSDKRVYGTTGFGTRVDLPLDMISAVGMSTITKGVRVATSAGIIKFMYIDNALEIYSIINDLLLARQGREKDASEKHYVELSAADEIKKYKELLDQGIISQQEFETKKQQLLK